MASPPATLSRRSTLVLLPAIVRLAWWRLRQTWRSLLVIWLGMIAMGVLICSVPLFARVSSTIGLRSVLSSIPLNQQRINVTFYSLHPTSDQILWPFTNGKERGQETLISVQTGTDGVQ